MFLVGLTGGIAAGKSVVSELWTQLGASVMDADILAREVVEPGTQGLEMLVDRFGDAIVMPDGSLNRNALAKMIFDEPLVRKEVESLLHPLIKTRAQERMSALPQSSICVYVIPLLYESGSNLPFDFVVTVEAPEDEQIKRLVESRNLTPYEAIQRIESQAKPAQRANLADRVLSSNQTLDELKSDARKLWVEIESMAKAKEGH